MLLWEKQGPGPLSCLEARLTTPPQVSLLKTFSQAIRKYLEQQKLRGGHRASSQWWESQEWISCLENLHPSSEISPTAGHKTRDNEGKQPGWGGISGSPPQLWPLATAFPKAESPSGFTAPLSYAQRHPWYTGACYPREQPATSTQSIQVPLPVSMQLLTLAQMNLHNIWSVHWEKKKSLHQPHGNGWLPSPCTRCLREMEVSLKTSYLHTSEVPALFLAATSQSAIGKTRNSH